MIYLDKYCTSVVSYTLIVRRHSCRFILLPAIPLSSHPHHSRFPKSRQIISFADPHPLTLLDSYRSKNVEGEGARPYLPSEARDLLFLYFVVSLRRYFDLPKG